MLLIRNGLQLLDKLFVSLSRIEERLWRLEIAVSKQRQQLHRIEEFIKHLVGDPVKVAQLARRLESTTDALEQVVSDNEPKEE
jgi:hypothetical protein